MTHHISDQHYHWNFSSWSNSIGWVSTAKLCNCSSHKLLYWFSDLSLKLLKVFCPNMPYYFIWCSTWLYMASYPPPTIDFWQYLQIIFPSIISQRAHAISLPFGGIMATKLKLYVVPLLQQKLNTPQALNQTHKSSKWDMWYKWEGTLAFKVLGRVFLEGNNPPFPSKTTYHCLKPRLWVSLQPWQLTGRLAPVRPIFWVKGHP